MNMHACAHVRGMLQNSPLLPTGDDNVFIASALQTYLSKNLPTASPLMPTDAHCSERQIGRLGRMAIALRIVFGRLIVLFQPNGQALPPRFSVGLLRLEASLG
jgi:hypothetical protein